MDNGDSESSLDENNIPDDISELSEISDIKEDKIIFSIKFKSNVESDTDSCDSDNTFDTSSTSYTYNTFDTSDSQMLSKQDIKMKLLTNQINQDKIKPTPTNSSIQTDEFNDIFISIISQLAKTKPKQEININLIAGNINSDDSSDSYLHDYKFF